jgi:hypothetical protein
MKMTLKKGDSCAICLTAFVDNDDVLQEKGTDRFAHARCAQRLIKSRGATLTKGDQRLIAQRVGAVIPDLAKRFFRN